MIKVNSNISYLGKEIREWCTNNSEDFYSPLIKEKYYSNYTKHKPSDNVYYFVDYISPYQSFKECGSSKMAGISMRRDLDKSPRNLHNNVKNKKENNINIEQNRYEFFNPHYADTSNTVLHVNAHCTKTDEYYSLLIDTYDDPYLVYYSCAKAPHNNQREEKIFEDALFAFLKKEYPEAF